MHRVKGHRETNSSFVFIKLLTIWAKISFSRQGLFQYFHFTEYKTKYVQLLWYKSRDNERQV